MAQNPAVLWYTSDYLVGVIGMTWEEQGRYTYLLNLQHAKGHFDINQIMPDCPESVLAKFVQDENGLYYNERMEEETIKRNKYTESRRRNLSKKNDMDSHMDNHMEPHMEEHMEEHMENENENENENINITNKECEKVVDLYNSICLSLPKCTKLTDKRKKHIKQRIKDFDMPTIELAFMKAEESDFLSGRSGDWRAGFDWIISSEGNMTKILEGNYDGRAKPKSTHEKLAQAHRKLEEEYERLNNNQ